MENIFAGKDVYGSWSLKDSRNLNAEEQGMMSSACVVNSEYGYSACFFLKTGGKIYIPMSRDSALAEGAEIDLTKCKVQTLQRGGDTIERIIEG